MQTRTKDLDAKNLGGILEIVDKGDPPNPRSN